MPSPVAISTWNWGRLAVTEAGKLLNAGMPALDAAIAGAQAVEDDPGVRSVGYGAVGNRIGTISLDACVMDGERLETGAVAGVENIRHVAALARMVMEKTPHLLLVGEGAKWFALQNGFKLSNLQNLGGYAEWEARKPKEDDPVVLGHDTVTVLAMDQQGKLAGVCTTSGLFFKLPGRVGDSPIVGAGLYVDNEVGAAGGTGVGEEILRCGGAHVIIERMRMGQTPQQGCEFAVERVKHNARRRGVPAPAVCFIALDKHGNTGAACTLGSKFPFAVLRGETIEMHQGKEF